MRKMLDNKGTKFNLPVRYSHFQLAKDLRRRVCLVCRPACNRFGLGAAHQKEEKPEESGQGQSEQENHKGQPDARVSGQTFDAIQAHFHMPMRARRTQDTSVSWRALRRGVSCRKCQVAAGRFGTTPLCSQIVCVGTPHQGGGALWKG